MVDVDVVTKLVIFFIFVTTLKFNTMSVLNGTLYLVDVDGNPLGASTNASLSISVDLPDATTKDSAGWAEHIQGLRSWEGSFEGLYDPSETYTPKEITDLMVARTDFAMVFEPSAQTSGQLSFSGNASFTSFELTSEMESSMGWSASFTGNGVLTVSELA